MNLRIIVTGKNRKIANDVCEHLGADRGDYTLYKCAASKTALFDMALSERPHAIIICTGNETKDTVKVFDILKESSKAGYTAVIVIANDEDRKIFIDETNLAKITFLERPVSLWALYSKLDEVEKKAEKEEEQSTLGVEEFVNENAVEVFERKHILVVDDDVTVLRMTVEMLTKKNIQAVGCPTVDDLFDRMRQSDYDLYLEMLTPDKEHGVISVADCSDPVFRRRKSFLGTCDVSNLCFSLSRAGDRCFSVKMHLAVFEIVHFCFQRLFGINL